MSSQKPAFLLVANYSNRTGYAWNNIYRLFNVIAEEINACEIAVYVSFAQVEQPVDCIDARFNAGVFEFDPGDNKIPNYLSFGRKIRQRNIKTVYLTDQAAWCWWYGLLRLYGVRRIIVHSRVSVSDPKPALREKGLIGLLKALVSRLPLITADRVYAVSDFVRNRYIHKARFPASKIITIMNGIDVEKFKPEEQKNRIESTVTIFCGARATRYKGVESLIRATVKVKSKRPELRFQVRYAGSGPDLQQFERLVIEGTLQETFIFLGELDDIQTEVSKADVVVVPSIWGDACPSAVSEALASGKPLITTRAGGIPEIVGTEDNAVLIEPSDVEGLASALERLIVDEELRAQLGTNARARALSALDQKLYYETVIEQLFKDCSLSRANELGLHAQQEQAPN